MCFFATFLCFVEAIFHTPFDLQATDCDGLHREIYAALLATVTFHPMTNDPAVAV